MKDGHWEANLGHLDIMIGGGGGEGERFHCGSDVALKEVPRKALESPSLQTFQIWRDKDGF